MAEPRSWGWCVEIFSGGPISGKEWETQWRWLRVWMDGRQCGDQSSGPFFRPTIRAKIFPKGKKWQVDPNRLPAG
jgi:hypothetical protein